MVLTLMNHPSSNQGLREITTNVHATCLCCTLTNSIPGWKGTSSQSFSGNLCSILPTPSWDDPASKEEEEEEKTISFCGILNLSQSKDVYVL